MQVKVIHEFYDADAGMKLRQKGDVFTCTEDLLHRILAAESTSGFQLVETVPEKKVIRAKRSKNADIE